MQITGEEHFYSLPFCIFPNNKPVSSLIFWGCVVLRTLQHRLVGIWWRNRILMYLGQTNFTARHGLVILLDQHCILRKGPHPPFLLSLKLTFSYLCLQVASTIVFSPLRDEISNRWWKYHQKQIYSCSLSFQAEGFVFRTHKGQMTARDTNRTNSALLIGGKESQGFSGSVVNWLNEFNRKRLVITAISNSRK